MKLHLGCGSVYLYGYTNVDAVGMLAKDNPELVEKNGTTFENYYKYDFGLAGRDAVVDVLADIRDMPFENSSFDEVVMLHVLEHFPKYELKCVLGEINRVLRYGGSFIVGVPDTIGNAKLLLEAKTPKEEEWAIRLLEGTQTSQYRHHYCSYTNRSLRRTLAKHNFGEFEDMPNINFYPAIHLRAKKVNHDK